MAKESLEQMFAEVAAYLVELEEIRLPSLEAKVRDTREACLKAYETLSWLETRVVKKTQPPNELLRKKDK